LAAGRQYRRPAFGLRARDEVGQAIVLCGLLGWAFGPRNFMKIQRRPGDSPTCELVYWTLSGVSSTPSAAALHLHLHIGSFTLPAVSPMAVCWRMRSPVSRVRGCADTTTSGRIRGTCSCSFFPAASPMRGGTVIKL
jgi:hypothetical protein